MPAALLGEATGAVPAGLLGVAVELAPWLAVGTGLDMPGPTLGVAGARGVGELGLGTGVGALRRV